MNEKYIKLTDQLIQGYHLIDTELQDLKAYYESKLKDIDNRFKERF